MGKWPTRSHYQASKPPTFRIIRSFTYETEGEHFKFWSQITLLYITTRPLASQPTMPNFFVGPALPPVKAMLFSVVETREDISQKLFRDITHPSSYLYHLLPAPREQSLISRLRTYEKFPRVYTRTRRYCSFVNYALNNYQEKITNP